MADSRVRLGRDTMSLEHLMPEMLNRGGGREKKRGRALLRHVTRTQEPDERTPAGQINSVH